MFHREVSSSDKLYIQPTSIGQKMDKYFMDDLLGDYMPERYSNPRTMSQDSIEEENWAIIWPSEQFMTDVYKFNSNITNLEPASSPRDLSREILFFNPKAYALMEPDTQSQFITYESHPIYCNKDRGIPPAVPHIKSYTRIYSDDIHKGSSCKCHDIIWTILTSACLSKGAQGEYKPYTICKDCRHLRRGFYEYRNFELGVFFHSTNNRQYVAYNSDCPIHGMDATSGRICNRSDLENGQASSFNR